MTTIDIFPWNEHFNTGLKTVDNQHKKLVEILNSLASHIAYNSNEDDLNTIFQELTNYTLYHFETEEAIWNKYLPNDPLDSDHQSIHQQFVDTVLKLKNEQGSRPLIELAEEALGFLARWLASHILETDRYMAYLIFGLKDGLTLSEAKEQAAVKMSGSTRLLIDIILSIYGTLSTNTLHLMRELKVHQNFEQDVDNQHNYRDLLLDLSTNFINLPLGDIDSNINNALEKMANFVSTDRAYIFDYDYDAKTTTNTYEWCSEGITPQIEELKDVPMKYVPGWPETHAKGEYVLIQDLSLIEGPLHEVLSPQGIQSLVTFPLFEHSKCTGFVGFDAVKVKHNFSSSEIAILEIFSKLLSNIANRRHHEAALSQERSFLKTLFQTIPDLVWTKDVDGVYLSSNARFQNFFGAKEADVIGKTDYDFVDKHLADLFRLNDNKVIDTGQIYITEEAVLFNNDGHEEILQATKVPIYDKEGKINGVMGVARDITSIKEIQKVLEEAQSLAKIGNWEYDLETDILTASDELLRIHGFTDLDMTIQKDTFYNLFHPDDIVMAEQDFINSLKTKEMTISQNRIIRYGDNAVRYLEHRWITKYKDSKAYKTVGTTQDITEDKIKEEALLLSNKRFEYAEIAGNVGSWEYDIETQQYWGSKQASLIFGLPRDATFFSTELVESCMVEKKLLGQALVNLVEKGIKYNLEYEINPLDGSNSKIISSIATVEVDDFNKPLKVVGFIQDITERANLQKELEDEKNRFTLAVEGSKDGLWDWNLQTNELLFGERFEIMLGYTPGTLANNTNTWFNLLHPEDSESANKVIEEYLDKKGEGVYESTFRLRAKDGSWRWILGRGKAEFDKEGIALRFVGFNTDITEQKEYQYKLDHTAKHDSLTNLPNRFLLSELLTHEMSITKRNNKQLALLFIDLDGFKEVNDTYGHDAGDKVLSVLASRMNNTVRESDIVSRIGGDEFVIVITDLNKSEELIPLLKRLLIDLSSNINYEKYTIHVSASIGVSIYPQRIDIGNEVLLRQADQAMYRAKIAGKNQYSFFDIEASEELKENQKNIITLREAIITNQLVLYYQPKVDMKNNKVIGLEALLRWNHPIKGLLFPDEFLPLIEQDSSLMIELGKWVFEKAFSDLESLHMQGLDIMLSINVSSHEVQQSDFPLYLKKLFDKHQGIKENTIEIELLETAALDNFELTSQTLKECQKLGVSIAVDDFGTGFSSLNYLKKFPMNTLKIDKSFVMDMLHESSSLSIIEASLGLAHAFNTEVVAEGVESEEHGKILLQLGCKIAQGYIISKAMPEEDVKEWIASYKGFSSWAEVEPINTDARIILYAFVEHNSWINSLENFIKNNNENLPQLEESRCYLGKWIKNSDSIYHDYPEFEHLQTLHTYLHNYTEDLLLCSNENDKAEGLKKLKSLSKELIKVLELLIVDK